MKRRLLVALFISIVLLLVLSIAVIADEVIDWTSTNSLPTTAGSYKLTQDVTLSATWNVNTDITLNLNGYDVSIILKDNAIVISSPATLTIQGNGCISHTCSTFNECNFVIVDGGVLNFYDATLTSDIRYCLMGAGVRVNSGTFNMFSGEISGCETASGNGYGGGVYVASGASFNMYGGRITGNIAKNGGGAFFTSGSVVTLSGGEISGNDVTDRGGGVYSLQTTADLLELSGGISIKGNTINGTISNNFDFMNCPVLTITGILNGEIGVTTTSSDSDSFAITNGFSGTGHENNTNVFVSNRASYVTGVKNGEVVLGIERTVTFYYNDGTDVANTVSAAHGSDYTVPACTFTKSGYRFTAWNTASDGSGTPYAPGSTIEVEGSNVTLYAQWAEIVPEFSGHSVTLTGEVGLNFLMILPDGLDYSGSYMEFTLQGSTSRVYTTEAVHESSGKYRFTCYVSSIQMAEKVTPVFHYDSKSVNGTAYSVADYIDYAKEHSSEAEFAAVIDIVNALADYGYYAQIRLSAIRGWRIGTDYAEMTGTFTSFSTAQKSEVTSAVSDKGLSKTIKDTALVEKITYSMDFLSSPLIYIYVKPVSVISDIKAFEVTGETKALAVETMPDGRYRVIISAGMIYNVETTHNISIKSGDTEVATVDVSGFSYVRAAMGSGTSDEINFMTAFYRFYAATKNYVKTHTGS